MCLYSHSFTCRRLLFSYVLYGIKHIRHVPTVSQHQRLTVVAVRASHNQRLSVGDKCWREDAYRSYKLCISQVCVTVDAHGFSFAGGSDTLQSVCASLSRRASVRRAAIQLDGVMLLHFSPNIVLTKHCSLMTSI